ncbi:hypothetical protein J1605_007169 [Eschrichtius robustus]|uniref:BEACH-type PH domain-containing protein n=1 Tax=Eschrichtius robustus TaxID=9764 RepID=A0AB34H2Z3_ESCRO|nr:hypothetical protein J1605_007169 [Eschrichtius robustus]
MTTCTTMGMVAQWLLYVSTWMLSKCRKSKLALLQEEKCCQPNLSQLHDFWRLDYWEDDLRRRRRFVRNAFGSTHAEALLKAAIEYGTEEDVVKSKKTFRSQAIVNQNAETELMLEGDDDAVSLLQEKEIDNLAGPVVLSTPAQLIAPVVVAKGTLSITTTEIYFEVDEDDPAFKKIDTKMAYPNRVYSQPDAPKSPGLL